MSPLSLTTGKPTMLREEHKRKMFDRVRGLLAEIDSEVRLLDVLLDSNRENLAFVMQKDQWPIVLGMTWLDFVSHRDEVLKSRLEEGLRQRLEAARERQIREEEE